MINQQYGRALQKLIKSKELRPAEVSRKTGIGQGSLSKILNGQTLPSLDQLDSILSVLHISLSEYDFFLNNFTHNYEEEILTDISRSYFADNKAKLEEIYQEATTYGYRWLALAAKSCLGSLTESEQLEISDFLMGLEIWTFYELSLLSLTVESLSPVLISSIIHGLQKKEKKLILRHKYRRLLIQITCWGEITCILANKQKEAHDCFTYAKILISDYERDLYARNLYHFTEGLYAYYYSFGEPEKKAAGLEEMKKVIEIFDWLESRNIAKHYQRFLDTRIFAEKVDK